MSLPNATTRRLPKLVDKVTDLSARVDEHLKRMGAVCELKLGSHAAKLNRETCSPELCPVDWDVEAAIENIVTFVRNRKQKSLSGTRIGRPWRSIYITVTFVPVHKVMLDPESLPLFRSMAKQRILIV